MILSFEIFVYLSRRNQSQIASLSPREIIWQRYGYR